MSTRTFKGTLLTGWRKATKQEQKDRGADVVFTREDGDGREYTIYACRCYESWEQWGERRDILAENVEDVERWRNGLDDESDES
jgi:hypothetical protein